jgi:hypothetical protein
MGSKFVNKQEIVNLTGESNPITKSEKKNRVYNFFIADEGQKLDKTSTNKENRIEKKGAQNTEQSINFFLPEWF